MPVLTQPYLSLYILSFIFNEKDRKGIFNQWVINTLVERDVVANIDRHGNR